MSAAEAAPDDAGWLRVQAIFHAALELPIAERGAYVAAAAGADAALRAEVQTLLAADEAVPAFLDAPLVALPPHLRSIADGASPAALPPFGAGDRIGPCRLLRELSRGAIAVVYLAEADGTAEPVALKALVRRLAPRLASERFRREVRVARRLVHPSVLPVLDWGESAELLWYTMPFVAGGSLRDRLRREGSLPVADAIRIACDVAGALHHAHERAIVHRDVKPENVLLTPAGPALLADFGISRRFRNSGEVDLDAEEPLTMAGARLGTPAYMSPEQSCGDHVDDRSDVYSLGCVLFEMLAGRLPFVGETALELFGRRLTTPAPSVRAERPDVPEAVDRAIRSALHRDPLARYPSAARFARALRER